MKIAILTPYPPSKDGIAEYSRKFVEELVLHRNIESIRIISKKSDGRSQDNQYPLMSLSPFDWIKIYSLIKDADIIHLQFDISNYLLQIPALFTCLFITKLQAKPKLVATYHEAYRDRELYGLLGIVFYRLFNHLFDRIYVHTILSKERLIKTYHAKNHVVRCIAHGTNSFISKRKNHAELRKRYGIPQNAKIILNFGYIYRTKGIEYLIDALNMLKMDGDVPYLLVAGKVPKRTGIFKYFQKKNEAYFENLKSQVRSDGLEKYVKFIGYVEYQELYSLFTLADVVVLPYTHIDQSGVLNYAIAAHTPVIASRIGGLKETLASTGILVEPRNATALANEIKEFFTRSSVDELAVKYAKLAKSIATSSVVNQIVEDYISLLQNHPEVWQVSAFFPPYLGGTEKVAESVSIGLSQQGYGVHVITSKLGYSKSYEDYSGDNFEISRLAAIELANLPIIFNLFLRLLRMPKKSIVHVHVVHAFIPEIALLAAKVRRSKFIAHFHLDVTTSGRFGFIFTLYKRTLFPIMLRSADKVIVFSADQATIVEQKYGVSVDQISIIPNGVRDEFYSGGVRQLHKRPRLLFVGRLSIQKNLQLLLHALANASDKFDTTIVGDGELSLALKNLAKQLKLKHVNFPGRKDGEDLLRYYRESDIFVLPSEREGMPLVLLEAMAMGLPIVATDVIGTHDIVENHKNGLLVPLNKPDEFRAALQEIGTSKSTYLNMSHNARRFADKYSWSKVVQQIAHLYMEVMRD